MQYEKPIMTIVKFQLEDVVCMSNEGWNDEDGGFQEVDQNETINSRNFGSCIIMYNCIPCSDGTSTDSD